MAEHAASASDEFAAEAFFKSDRAKRTPIESRTLFVHILNVLVQLFAVCATSNKMRATSAELKKGIFALIPTSPPIPGSIVYLSHHPLLGEDGTHVASSSPMIREALEQESKKYLGT